MAREDSSMEPTRRMLISAGVVGVILAGGASVAAVASAGRLDQARLEQANEVQQDGIPFSQPSPKDDLLSDGNPPYTSGNPPYTSSTGDGSEKVEPAQPREEEDFVVSHEINPTPGDALDYWNRGRMEDAKPYPLPVISVKPTPTR
ncbi:hypothetical protein AB0K60_15025 [Thermopolyspora sp. NPDC052614]|uniref:hypothetical protein n=1 Tax=Thermopolyspora sp. NPDC052614 TaxID=3155682 RepID=UPI00341BF7F8